MHNAIKMVLAVIFFGLVPHTALSHVDNIRAQIEAATHQSEICMAHRDVKGYMSGYTSDFQGRDIAGHIYDKQQSRQSFEKSISLSQFIQSQGAILNVQPTSKGAVVLSHEHTTVHILGRKTHKMHIVIFDGLWRSIWVRAGHNWLVWRETQLSQTITTDGKARVVKPSIGSA